MKPRTQYVFGGTGLQRARLRDLGFFIADTWRWKPNLTLNVGVRYELQLPFYPSNNSYSKASVEDVWGVSGVDNLFQPGVLTGRKPEFVHLRKGRRCLQHRPQQLGAERRLRVDARRLAAACSAASSVVKKATA